MCHDTVTSEEAIVNKDMFNNVKFTMQTSDDACTKNRTFLRKIYQKKLVL